MMTSNGVKNKPFGEAQATFIKNTRMLLDANAKSFLKGKDWRNLTPCGGRFVVGTLSASLLSAESFYVKPIAAFVPHLLLPNHTPSCPHCESPSHVETFGSKVKWIKCPKILFGITSHRYLDTKLYYCGACNRRFAGYDKKSLQLDANQWAGYFPFNLSSKFAVDDELYSYIVNAGNLPTATITKQLRHMVTQKYLSDHQYYLYLVGANRIKKEETRKVAANDSKQRTIDSIYERRTGKEVKLERRRRLAKSSYDSTTRNLRAAEKSLHNGLPLRDLMNYKNNRNNYGIRSKLKSIGVTKLQRLLAFLYSCRPTGQLGA